MLTNHVKRDIQDYGAKLSELHGKLEKARKDMLNNIEPAASALGEEQVFARDAEALAA